MKYIVISPISLRRFDDFETSGAGFTNGLRLSLDLD